MYRLKDIESIHMEVTEKCNLSCLMCDRNMNGGDVNPYLKNRELTFPIIHRSFPPSFIKQLKRISLCGNYGDPIIAKDTLQILKYFRAHNEKMHLTVITNGCARSSEWWVELAETGCTVRFGIDGLYDTHKIYRQGASFNVIMNNAVSFINAGGYAIWDYLVFGHNEHQIEKARMLSEGLGFKEFVVKKTGRFFSNVKLTGKDEHVGLKKPSEENTNKSLKKQSKLEQKYGSMKSYLDQVQIDCKMLKNKEIYISAEGIVLPCCWLAGQMYKWYMEEKSGEIWRYVNPTEHNIYYNSLESIFNTGIFDEIMETWSKDSLEDGKLKTCALKCGIEMDQFGDQYK